MKTMGTASGRARRMMRGSTAAAGAAVVLAIGVAAAGPAAAAPRTGQAAAAAQSVVPPTVFGWGSDFLGALGIGSRNDQRAAPTPIALPPGVLQISAGRNSWSS